MDISNEKRSLRKKYLKIRDMLDPSYIGLRSGMAVKNLRNLECVNDAKNILIYCSYGSEVSTWSFIEELLNDKDKNVFVPKVSGDDIKFYKILSTADLKEGYRMIPEPVETSEDLLYNEDVYPEDVINIVPGVVFDRACARMGYGRGFYDRFMAKHPGIVNIGLSFDEQISDTLLETEKHDIVLDYVVTPERIYGKDKKEI